MTEQETAMTMDEDTAARWAIRLDAGQLTPEEQTEIDAWLIADDRNQGSLLRAEAALVYLDRARAFADPQYMPRISVPSSSMKRRWFLAGSLATSAAAAAALVGLIITPPNEAFSTAVGEVRKLPLADGSIATINTASKITVELQPTSRNIVLDNGEAWFEVAHDNSRPFIVDAGDVRVQAVGTAFSVRRHDDGIDVLVTKGVVETWRVGKESERIRITGGQRSFVATNSSEIVAVKAGDEIDRALAWRSGGLALNGEPLSYAVSELNRYNRHQLLVEDPVLSRTPIVGYFRTDNPEGFANSVAALIGARVEDGPGKSSIVPTGS